MATFSAIYSQASMSVHSDIILGYDFQNMHKRLIMELSGSKSDLVIQNNTTPCALYL